MKAGITLFNSFPETKSGMITYIESVKKSILDGFTEPLKIAKQLKTFEEIVKQLRDDKEIKMMIENETDKYSEKTIDLFGAKFTKQERASYDYSECNDSDLHEMYERLAELKAQIKEREEFLKHVPDGFVNSNTGELVTKPTKTIQTIISVTLK